MSLIVLIPIVAFLAFLFGILFLVAPSFVKKLNEWGNRIVATDEETLAYRYLTGAFLILLGLLLMLSTL
ncbi:MAG: hypothetical protein D6762_08975 [Candidatus Neomarinimicrobiota bacterium]|nr:MAG: hypothetical protein D6762_08975 [Candidatus Neomarinimicrobiota bacterium]